MTAVLFVAVTFLWVFSQDQWLTALAPSLFVRAQIADCSQQTITRKDNSVFEETYGED